MANYHILDITDKRDKINVVFHIAIPKEINAVGINLQTALVQYLSRNGAITSMIPWDIGDELVDLQTGSIFEVKKTIQCDANASDEKKQAVIDAEYQNLVSTIPKIIKERL